MSENGNPELVEWVLNGETVQSPAGSTILEAAKAHGAEMPHFCYHPGLSIAGNCRICLVETNRSPKPAISCSERISPGLEVQTHSEKAVAAREGVMEFQLINHPLDCPVCDKSGECTLQDYSYEHGPDRSRFVENKNIRATKDLGPTIKIWGNRCIVCTRCVRFCDEVSGTGELCVVARGDRSVVDVFPGVPIDNALAGNVVDLCPVGALISKDFMFQSRVWNTESTDSVCAGCARGCNVAIETNEGFVKRLTPRENRDVNDWWMCDYGRYGWRYAHADERITIARRGIEAIPNELDAHRELGEAIRSHWSKDSGRAVIIVDPYLTCEEAHLVKRLAAGLSADVAGWLPPDGEAETFPGNFKISAEKAPNRRGVEAVLGNETFANQVTTVSKALSSGSVDLAIVFAGLPDANPTGALVEVIASAKRRVVFALFDGAWTEGAELVLPSGSVFEKEGTYVNEDGRLQRVRSKDRPGHAHQAQPGLETPSISAPWVTTELVALQRALVQVGDLERSLSSAGVFRQLADDNEHFRGHSHREIPATGVAISSLAPASVGGGTGS